MPNFITTSISWNGKETTDIFLKPLYRGDHPLLAGIRVIPNVQSSVKLNYFGAKSKILKAYAKGFSPASGAEYTQRTLTVSELKAEMAQDAHEFAQTIFETVLGKGVDWNNLEAAEAELRDAIIEVFSNAVLADVFRKFWLNDTDKETVSGGYLTGIADADYNEFDGIWKQIFDNASASPSASQIKRVAISSGAVAQVDTVTLTGTSGTANITVDGVACLATYNTSLTQTAANFAASHGTALAARNITVSSSGADVIFTSAIPGRPMSVSAAVNVSGTLAGTRAATTANTAAQPLSPGEARDTLKALYENANKALKQIPAGEKRFYVTDGVYESYLATLESAGTEAAYHVQVDGADALTYRGVPVIPMGWNVYLEQDSIEQQYYPHRVVYTVPDNLVLGLDAASDFSKAEFWYNKDEQENRYRMQLRMGAGYVHNDMIAAAY